MRNEVNFQGEEFLQREHKLFDAACETIESPDTTTSNAPRRASAGRSRSGTASTRGVTKSRSGRSLNGGVLLNCDYLTVP